MEITGHNAPLEESGKLKVCSGLAELLERMEPDSLGQFRFVVFPLGLSGLQLANGHVLVVKSAGPFVLLLTKWSLTRC